MWIKQEAFFKLLGSYIFSNPTNGDKQINSLPGKAGRCMHISVVSTKYAYSLVSLNLHCIFDGK